MQMMSSNEMEEEVKFKQNLLQFLISNSIIKGGEFYPEFNSFLLYKLVCRKGGYQAISNRNKWEHIAKEIEAHDQAQKIKVFYYNYIYPYQKKYYFGHQNEEKHPILICSNPRKIVKTENREMKSKNDEFSNLPVQLAKSIEEEERGKKLFYLNKNKLNPNKAQAKKIALSLSSYMERKYVVYALNMLMLYSVNNHPPFLFENYQKIFTALSSFAHSIYLPKNDQDRQDLRTITLIFRNLTMNPTNLKFMLGTTIFQLFVNMFNQGFDHECSKNIVDVMTGLVKVGWDCTQIMKNISIAILDDKFEDVESSVELLRGLIDERDDNLAPAVTQNLKALIRALISNDVSIEVKEQIFEILAFVTDVSSQSREQFLKNDVLLSIIVGVLQHMRNQEKLIQFAALTLSNMSSTTTSKHYLKMYETELMMIGFTDDSLAGIMATILSEIQETSTV